MPEKAPFPHLNLQYHIKHCQWKEKGGTRRKKYIKRNSYVNRNQFIKNGISQRKKFAIQMICSSMKIWGLCIGCIVLVLLCVWQSNGMNMRPRAQKLTRFNGEKHTIVPAMLLILWQTNEKNCVCGLKPFAGQRQCTYFKNLFHSISFLYYFVYRFSFLLFCVGQVLCSPLHLCLFTDHLVRCLHIK